ncbi:hypothetical protein H9P43_001342 [Blastocladiella emersonii ATCC 22665]|nr:hypothetical protein H9P43_001342 [Blastocladiella emersonii ATCC 22665]
MLARSALLSASRSAARPAARPMAARAMSSIIDPTMGLTEEQCQIFETSRAFAKAEMGPRAYELDMKETELPRDLFKAAGELGFGGVYADPDFGGAGMTRMDAALIFEALSTVDVSTSAFISIHNMALYILDSFGSQELKQKYLPSLTTMDHVASYCLTEPGAGSDAGNLATTAKRDGKNWKLNGSKQFISNAGGSDIYIVMARTGGPGPSGISAFVVDANDAVTKKGLSFGKKERKVGWNSQPTRAVIMEDMLIPAENLIGEEGKGFKYAMKALDGGRVNIAASSVGGAQGALETTLDYVGQRKQFGKTISTFQNTQFRLAEMATALTSSRLMVRHAATLLDEGSPMAPAVCAMAKIEATEKCFDICDQAMQLHGGYGYLREYTVQQFQRDLRVHRILEGTNEIMRLIVGRELLK